MGLRSKTKLSSTQGYVFVIDSVTAASLPEVPPLLYFSSLPGTCPARLLPEPGGRWWLCSFCVPPCPACRSASPLHVHIGELLCDPTVVFLDLRVFFFFFFFFTGIITSQLSSKSKLSTVSLFPTASFFSPNEQSSFEIMSVFL